MQSISLHVANKYADHSKYWNKKANDSPPLGSYLYDFRMADYLTQASASITSEITSQNQIYAQL